MEASIEDLFSYFKAPKLRVLGVPIDPMLQDPFARIIRVVQRAQENFLTFLENNKKLHDKHLEKISQDIGDFHLDILQEFRAKESSILKLVPTFRRKSAEKFFSDMKRWLDLYNVAMQSWMHHLHNDFFKGLIIPGCLLETTFNEIFTNIIKCIKESEKIYRCVFTVYSPRLDEEE